LQRKFARAWLGAAVLAFSAFVPPALAADAPAAAVPPAQREAIEAVIQDYLQRHPEVVQNALQALQAREERERARAQREALAQHRGELLDDRATPVGGDPQGKVAVVEFFDYSCPHCKQSEPAIQALLAKDRSVRVVYKELPILGPDSLHAARAALASMKQGKYPAFHKALMEADSVDPQSVKAIAAKVGLDVPRLLRDMEDPAIAQAIERNSQLASELGIQGTPAFVIGGQLLPGEVDANTLSALVAVEKAQLGLAQNVSDDKH